MFYCYFENDAVWSGLAVYIVKMKSILFVCLGNICRSPMAEFIMKDKLCRYGMTEEFYIASAATSAEEYGNPIYPPAKDIMRRNHIWFDPAKTSVQVQLEDYGKFDYIIGMDEQNRRNLLQLLGGDPKDKVSLLMEYTGVSRNVADPWYTRNFDVAFRDIDEGCEALCGFLGLKK